MKDRASIPSGNNVLILTALRSIPNNRFVCVADLGSDRVEVFHISPESKLKSVAHWEATPGAGPRHVSFHPNGKWLYSINELDSTMAVLAFDDKSGKLSEVQIVDTLPANTDVSNTTAEVVVHPNGKFVYGSNRGPQQLRFVFRDRRKQWQIESCPARAHAGRPSAIRRSGSHGKDLHRRKHAPRTRWSPFTLTPKTGKLKPTGHTIEVPRPMCIVFVR